MPTCPSCLAVYPADVKRCPEHGQELLPDETFAHVDRELGVGDTVGEYQIEGKLGEGGFGAVYAALHPLIGKQAAVKVLSREFSANPQMVSRFVSEARAVNQIRHRNIVDIFSFGALPDGRQYYVMERLDGQPLDKHLAARGRMPVAEAVALLRGVARALDAAHAKGILHRDLKPENIFLAHEEDGRPLPKLLDFGLVKQMGEASGGHKTKTGTPMGTPYYMSPEQCRGREVDARTDVYSFGVMVFEILTGQLPFSGESPMDVIVKHMTEAPPPITQVAPDLPASLDASFARMLAKDPAARPRTVGEALDEIARAVGMSADAASTTGAPITPAGAPPSNPALATARTMLDPSSGMGSDLGVAHGAPGGQTFLGAESDVVVPKRGRAGLIAAVAAGLLVVGIGGGIALKARGGEATGVPPPASISAAPEPRASAPEPPPSASIAPAPAASTVSLTVASAPDGAEVFLDDKPLGKAPGPFRLDVGASGKLSVRAAGYTTVEVPIEAKADLAVPVTMAKAKAGPPIKKGPPTKHSDIPGFDDK